MSAVGTRAVGSDVPPKGGYRSVKATARELGLSELTVRRAISAGRIPAVQINGNWRIPASYFEDLERAAYSRFNEIALAPLPKRDRPGRPRQTPRVQWREVSPSPTLRVIREDVSGANAPDRRRITEG